MKILVIATPLLMPLTGIGQYIRSLFTAMDKMPDADINMYYGLRCEKGVRPLSSPTVQKVTRTLSVLQRLIPRARTLRRVAEKALFSHHTSSSAGQTLHHEPSYLPLPYNGPQVVTVCDLSCFDHPQTHPKERVELMQRNMPAAIAKADHIIVISEATGAALQRWFNVDKSRITNTYLAADPRFQPQLADTLAVALASLGLRTEAYVLCVGTLEPRKNLTTLFLAYGELPAALRQRYPLVVAGMSGWNTEALLKSAENLIRRGELRLLGYVADAVIPSLYAGAAAFCYPSRYEGFGLPALEAMASGVPVITSNQTSLPEVEGDAGLMFDTDDVDSLREQLQRLLEDRAFAEMLDQRGLARSRMFSWERCAKETFAVYEKVLQQRGGTS
ncbi:MAG: glycosyltransferase family 4 protein [Burkholderiaceae bacterium]